MGSSLRLARPARIIRLASNRLDRPLWSRHPRRRTHQNRPGYHHQMMNDPKIMQIFADAGAVVTDSHFVYTSGRHSSIYINKDALYLHPPTISALCELMARPYDPETIDIVVGPVLGGIVLS